MLLAAPHPLQAGVAQGPDPRARAAPALAPIATFANPLVLDPRTGNVYAQTAASGEFNLRAAGRGGAGMIAPSSLEGANVDLAEEFTKMIVTQRAYSANARVITTTDEMLDELIRISR